jgi:hypothetical protein
VLLAAGVVYAQGADLPVIDPDTPAVISVGSQPITDKVNEENAQFHLSDTTPLVGGCVPLRVSSLMQPCTGINFMRQNSVVTRHDSIHFDQICCRMSTLTNWANGDSATFTIMERSNSDAEIGSAEFIWDSADTDSEFQCLSLNVDSNTLHADFESVMFSLQLDALDDAAGADNAVTFSCGVNYWAF